MRACGGGLHVAIRTRRVPAVATSQCVMPPPSDAEPKAGVLGRRTCKGSLG